ncbi:hypothetical protein CHUAL_000332 [Chamberlinius hualienensis]
MDSPELPEVIWSSTLKPSFDRIIESESRGGKRVRLMGNKIQRLDLNVLSALEFHISEYIEKIFVVVEVKANINERLTLILVIQNLLERLSRITDVSIFDIYISVSIRYLDVALRLENVDETDEFDPSNFLKSVLDLVTNIIECSSANVLLHKKSISEKLPMLIYTLNWVVDSNVEYGPTKRHDSISCLLTLINRFQVIAIESNFPDINCVLLQSFHYVLKMFSQIIERRNEDVETKLITIETVLGLILVCFSDERLDYSYSSQQLVEGASKKRRVSVNLNDWIVPYRESVQSFLKTIFFICHVENDDFRTAISNFCVSLFDRCLRFELRPSLIPIIAQFVDDANEELHNTAETAIKNFVNVNDRFVYNQLLGSNLNLLIEEFPGLFERDIKLLDCTLTSIMNFIICMDEFVSFWLQDTETVNRLLISYAKLLTTMATEPKFGAGTSRNCLAYYDPGVHDNPKFSLQIFYQLFPGLPHIHNYVEKIEYSLRSLAANDESFMFIKQIVQLALEEPGYRIQLLLFLNWILGNIGEDDITDGLKNILNSDVMSLYKQFQDLPCVLPCYADLNMVQRVCKYQKFHISLDELYENIQLNCLAIAGLQRVIELVVQTSENLKEASDYLSGRCRSLTTLVSLGAMRCLYSFVQKSGENLFIDAVECKEAIMEMVKTFNLNEDEVLTESYQWSATETFKVISTACFLIGSEQSLPIWKAIWPSLMELFRNEIDLSHRLYEIEEDYKKYKYSLGYNLLLEMLRNIGFALRQLEIDDEELKRLVHLCLPCLSTKQSNTMQKESLHFYRTLFEINKPLVGFELRTCEQDEEFPDHMKSNIVRLLKDSQ